MEQHYHIATLIHTFKTGKLTESEKQTLDRWIESSDENKKLFDASIDPKNQLEKLETYERFNKERSWSAIEANMGEAKVIPMRSTSWLRYAAAIFIPLMAVTAYFLINRPEETRTLSEIDQVIKPGTQKATLVLADGASVELEGQNVPNQISQKVANITNENQQLTYAATSEPESNEPLIYNELITPKGGTYNLMLADGTKVWLNADSKLRYPAAFTDSTRQVFLEGEALLDVAHNGKPFIVTSAGQDVRVLGTIFNIAAYPGESVIKTTLVEGSVRVTLRGDENSISKQVMLKPNEQATYQLSEESIQVAEVRAQNYTSWVDGKFEFDKDNLDQVMRQLSRWYDFDYRFDNPEAQSFHFSGRIDNTESISAILEMLQLTTDVEFKMDDETIVIL